MLHQVDVDGIIATAQIESHDRPPTELYNIVDRSTENTHIRAAAQDDKGHAWSARDAEHSSINACSRDTIQCDLIAVATKNSNVFRIGDDYLCSSMCTTKNSDVVTADDMNSSWHGRSKNRHIM